MDTTRIGMAVSDEAVKKSEEKKLPKKVAEPTEKVTKKIKKKGDENAE